MSAKCLLHVLLCKSCGTPSWPGGGGYMKNVIMDRIAPIAQIFADTMHARQPTYR